MHQNQEPQWDHHVEGPIWPKDIFLERKTMLLCCVDNIYIFSNHPQGVTRDSASTTPTTMLLTEIKGKRNTINQNNPLSETT